MEVGGIFETEFKAWVPFGEDAEVLIKYISRDQLLAINKKCRRMIYVNHQRMEELDAEKANQMLGSEVVMDWKGFKRRGEDLPFNAENLEYMMRWGDFSRFVNETC